MTVNDYTTVTILKQQFPANNFGTTYDVLLGTLITRASRAIDGFLHRSPGSFAVSANVIYYYNGNDKRELWIDELAEVPAKVEVAESGQVDDAGNTGGVYTTWATSDYWCWPMNAPGEGMPYQRLDLNLLTGTKAVWYRFPRAVKISGMFGFATTSNTPDEIKQAVEIQTIRWFKRAQQSFADVGAITQLNQLQYVKKLDPDIENILNIDKFAVPFISSDQDFSGIRFL